MEIVYFALGWLICGAVGFYLAQLHWRREYDFDMCDLYFFGSMAVFGAPFLLAAAILFWAFTLWSGYFISTNDVVWPKRKGN